MLDIEFQLEKRYSEGFQFKRSGRLSDLSGVENHVIRDVDEQALALHFLHRAWHVLAVNKVTCVMVFPGEGYPPEW